MTLSPYKNSGDYKLLWLLKQSIYLDGKLLRHAPLTLDEKIDVICKKYFLLGKHIFRPFVFGKSVIRVLKRNIYYEHSFGIPSLQSILGRHSKLLTIAGITKASVIIDAGANVGYFSILSRILFPKSTIYAFEPIPATYEILRKNLANDVHSKTFCTALSDTSESLQMSSTENSTVSRVQDIGSTPVNTTTLDDVVKRENIQVIDILKIDVENYEAHVLRGASEALKKTKYLLIEIAMTNNPHYTFSSLVKLLSSNHYDFQLVAFRNFGDTYEGAMPLMDALFKNVKA